MCQMKLQYDTMFPYSPVKMVLSELLQYKTWIYRVVLLFIVLYLWLPVMYRGINRSNVPQTSPVSVMQTTGSQPKFGTWNQSIQDSGARTFRTSSNIAGRDDVTKVVLVTYYRGGSTFLGELFNQNPDAFYWFEPLAWPVYRMAQWQLNIEQEDFYITKNGTFRKIPQEFIHELTSVLIDILNCDLKSVNRSIRAHYFLTEWGKSVTGLPYANCLKQYEDSKQQYDGINTCMPWLESACRTSRLRVAKTIRIPAFLARELAARDPSIKFIYYHRDPRGMTVSRAKFGGFLKWNDTELVEQKALKQCALSRHDHAGYSDFPLESSKPFITSYEKFALEPSVMADTIYKYLGLDMPDIVRTWLHKHTTADAGNGPLGTTRNSTATALKWTRHLPKFAYDLFIKHCADVFKTQGYK